MGHSPWLSNNRGLVDAVPLAAARATSGVHGREPYGAARVSGLPLATRQPHVGSTVRVAHPLHARGCMNTDCIGWRRLTPDSIADVPEAAAVFEVANLVRTIQLIDAAQGNLRARLDSLLHEQTKLPATPGGYYFRYDPAEQEADALAARLEEYRKRHMGRVPLGNREPLHFVRVASRRAA
jgi:hypothetical protein